MNIAGTSFFPFKKGCALKRGAKVKPRVFLSLASAKNNQLCPPANRMGPRVALEVVVKRRVIHFTERLKCKWKHEFD
jgi:hypothetical protein